MSTSATSDVAGRQDLPEPGTGAPVGHLTLTDLLDGPVLAGVRVLAGHDALGRVVRGVRTGADLAAPAGWTDRLVVLTGAEGAEQVGKVQAWGASGVLLVPQGAVPRPLVRAAERLGLALLSLPAGDGRGGPAQVAQELLEMLLERQHEAAGRAEAVHRALLRTVLDGGGPPQVADELARRLGAAVVVTTAAGRVVADAGEVPAVARAYGASCFDAAGRLRTEAEVVGLSRHEGLAGQHVVVPMLAAGVDHGRLAVFAPRFGPGDVATVERAAAVAAVAVTRQLAVRAVEAKYQGDFVRDLLEGQVDPEAAVSHAARLGWDVDRPLAVVLVARGHVGTGDDPVLELCRRTVHGGDPHAPVVPWGREVVVVTGVGRPDDAGALRRLVAVLARDPGVLAIGASRVAAGPGGLPAAHRQAVAALRVARRRPEGRWALFGDLGVLRLLSLVGDPGELAGFVTETLGPLAGDDADAADLRLTLRTLLETNLNVAESSRTLHFHYNTMRYRITKLERLLGPFTTDPALRLDLQVALQGLSLVGKDDGSRDSGRG